MSNRPPLNTHLHGTALRAASGCNCHRCAGNNGTGPIYDPMGVVSGVPLGVKSYAGCAYDARKLFEVVSPEEITARYGPAAAASMASNGVPEYVFDLLCVTVANLHPAEVIDDWYVIPMECEMHPEIYGPHLPWSARTIRSMIARPDWVPPAACGLLRQDDTLVDELVRLVRLGFAPRSPRALELLSTRLSPGEIVAMRVEAMSAPPEDDEDEEPSYPDDRI